MKKKKICNQKQERRQWRHECHTPQPSLRHIVRQLTELGSSPCLTCSSSLAFSASALVWKVAKATGLRERRHMEVLALLFACRHLQGTHMHNITQHTHMHIQQTNKQTINKAADIHMQACTQHPTQVDTCRAPGMPFPSLPSTSNTTQHSPAIGHNNKSKQPH